MKYTVIIPTHDRPDLLSRALRSVYGQAAPATEIIVVDDASEIPVAASAEIADPRLRIIRLETASGAAIARNVGLDQASCDIVAFLDDDDEWLPQKMRCQLDYFNRNPHSVLVTCGCTIVKEGNRYDQVFAEDFLSSYGDYDSYVGSFSFLCLRRKPEERFQSLDPTLPAFQDWDYYLTLKRKGGVGVIERSLAIYHEHTGPRITHTSRNRYRGLRRCFMRHRAHLSADACQWVFARLLFDRAQRCQSWTRRAWLIVASVKLGYVCRLPWRVKTRALAKRVLNLGINLQALENFRTTVFARMHQLSKRDCRIWRASAPAPVPSK
jgi:GT2 family glycosyltransferase